MLAPMTSHPNITAWVPCPVGSHPDGANVWPDYPSAAYPNPTAVPGPVPGNPNILRTRDDGHDLNLGRWRCQRRFDHVCSGRSLRLAIGGWSRVAGLLILIHRHILNLAFHATGG